MLVVAVGSRGCVMFFGSRNAYLCADGHHCCCRFGSVFSAEEDRCAMTNTSLQHLSPKIFPNTSLHQFSTTLLSNTSLQYSSLQHLSTTLLSNILLQHFSTTLFPNTSLQRFSTTLVPNTSLQRRQVHSYLIMTGPSQYNVWTFGFVVSILFAWFHSCFNLLELFFPISTHVLSSLEVSSWFTIKFFYFLEVI